MSGINAKELSLPTGDKIQEEELNKLMWYASLIRVQKLAYFECIEIHPEMKAGFSNIFSDDNYKKFEENIEMFLGNPSKDWKQKNEPDFLGNIHDTPIKREHCSKFMEGAKSLIEPFELNEKRVQRIVLAAEKLAAMTQKQSEDFFTGLMP